MVSTSCFSCTLLFLFSWGGGRHFAGWKRQINLQGHLEDATPDWTQSGLPEMVLLESKERLAKAHLRYSKTGPSSLERMGHSSTRGIKDPGRGDQSMQKNSLEAKLWSWFVIGLTSLVLVIGGEVASGAYLWRWNLSGLVN